MKTNTAHNTADTLATKRSCDVLYVPPEVVVVNVGSASVSIDIAMSAAMPAPDPSTRKVCSRCLSPPTTRHIPTTPLQMIMVAA